MRMSDSRAALALPIAVPIAKPAPALVRLCDLPAGGIARLDRRELAEGEACLLAAMGLTEGCRLVMRSCGDPCIVEVRSTRIGLARSVASRLLVSPAGQVAGSAVAQPVARPAGSR